MEFKIYFTIDGTEDYFIVEADTIEELKQLAEQECIKRNLTVDKNNLYSIKQ
jgi:hypothetical protein